MRREGKRHGDGACVKDFDGAGEVKPTMAICEQL